MMEPKLIRVTVALEPEDWQALKRMADMDARPKMWQIVWLIRQEAARRGLLELDTTKEPAEASHLEALCE